MNAPDYGRFAPGLPTAEALAIRDKLADALASATSPAARARAEEQLAGHMLAEGLRLEDFSTPSGRAFKVRVSVSKPRPRTGREREARRWLAAQGGSARTLAHRLLERGGGLPAELFEPLNPRVNVDPK